jgi:hypothetical protein
MAVKRHNGEQLRATANPKLLSNAVIHRHQMDRI